MNNLYLICTISIMTIGYVPVKGSPLQDPHNTARKGKIINGEEAKTDQFPWIASIKYRSGERTFHICGGSIISERHVLTAAHCFDNELEHGHFGDSKSNPNLAQYTVTLGDYSLSADEEHSTNYSIEKITFHQEYRRIPIANDIVLLQLNKKIIFSEHIMPVSLPKQDVQTAGNAVAVGWGEDPLLNKEDNSNLRFVTLQIFDNAQCNRIYLERHLGVQIDNYQICAGKLDIIKDTNQGDSGGPLLMKLGEQTVLVGICSAGTRESRFPKAPGIYTRTFKYLDWIEEHTRDNDDAPVIIP